MKDFSIVSYCWHEVGNKILDSEIEILLNNTLNIKQYSHEVKQYLVSSVAFRPTIEEGNLRKYFSSKKEILYNFYTMNWQDLMKLNQQQAISLQAKMYLEAIKEIPNIRGMKKRQFNTELFYHDVEFLFKKEKLIID